ncbi:hypothetical protein ACFRQM_13800 [Streptomyces sp. NPDC056831]|uniref:hypothetical protein n=1 Tax=Streptomyces sp. NPDC056831 TaxID=3345954 RepID=UPI0036C9CE41
MRGIREHQSLMGSEGVLVQGLVGLLRARAHVYVVAVGDAGVAAEGTEQARLAYGGVIGGGLTQLPF